MFALYSLVVAIVSAVGAPSITHSSASGPALSDVQPYVLPAKFTFAINGAVVHNVQSIVGLDAFCVEYRNGSDWSPQIKVPGGHKWPTVTLRRGRAFDNSLFQWHQMVVTGRVEHARSTCTLDTITPMGKPVRFTFQDCLPSSYEISGPSLGNPGAETLTFSFGSVALKVGNL